MEAQRKSLELEQTIKLNPMSKSTLNLTPLIAPAALSQQRAGPRTFTPVSNILAIQKAKEKIDQLKAAKQQQQLLNQTIAHTVAKGVGRVAHTNNGSTQVIKNLISCNQYLYVILFYKTRTLNQRHQYWNQLLTKFRITYGCSITI